MANHSVELKVVLKDKMKVETMAVVRESQLAACLGVYLGSLLAGYLVFSKAASMVSIRVADLAIYLVESMGTGSVVMMVVEWESSSAAVMVKKLGMKMVVRSV